MALFVISYDLHNQRDYPRIWQRLEELGAAKLLESLWLLDINNSTTEVRDHLKSYIDQDDSLAVIELKQGSMWATVRAMPNGINWLKQHLRS
ncbi:SinR [Methylobacterium radiodurans]|uniref:CRISPR-associated endoribonuclease Cas2 n=1 Tax=Methylobacterium radiodurans TaxID=2202828 RepID=A0A2U8VP97_9HYPH|nr:SinR [Methylobacterium radiodurans]AWN35212.1 SinR [Methylobacterium radiodurans]